MATNGTSNTDKSSTSNAGATNGSTPAGAGGAAATNGGTPASASGVAATNGGTPASASGAPATNGGTPAGAATAGMGAAATAQQPQPNQQGPLFGLRQVYLKDASLESPHGPVPFQGDERPRFELAVKTRARRVGDDLHEVVLQLNVEAKQEARTAFLVEVQQAGLFLCKNIPEQQMEHLVVAGCPNILFPYAREAIDSLVVKGGFPALQLAPIDFDAVYAQHKLEAAKQGQQAPQVADGQQGSP